MKTPLGENSYSFLLANKICLQLMGMPSSSDSYYKPWVGFERKGEWGQQKEGEKTRRGNEKEKDMGAGEGSLPSTAASGMRSVHPRRKETVVLIF